MSKTLVNHTLPATQTVIDRLNEIAYELSLEERMELQTYAQRLYRTDLILNNLINARIKANNADPLQTIIELTIAGATVSELTAIFGFDKDTCIYIADEVARQTNPQAV